MTRALREAQIPQNSFGPVIHNLSTMVFIAVANMIESISDLSDVIKLSQKKYHYYGEYHDLVVSVKSLGV